MTWESFLVAWVAGTFGVTVGRWLWGRRASRASQQQKQGNKSKAH